MANFFDDEADDDNTTFEREETVARAGPSRQRQYELNTRSESPDLALPPPLAQRNSDSNNNKGKGRASTAAAAVNHAPARHARASSTMSIDNYDNNTTTTRGGGVNGRNHHRVQQRSHTRGFLDDNDNSDNDDDGGPSYNTRRNGDAPEDDDDEDESIGNESQIQHLLRIYMNERMSPELLKWDDELIGNLMINLEAQTEAASVLLSSGATSKPDEHERLLLVQMEIERVRWLLRSYLRTRTYKIEKQAQYLLKTPLARLKMSDVEQGYAERYHSLVIKHFQNSVTGNIPERLGRLDEDEMVIRPELDQAVFARARRDCPPITLPDSQLLEMKKGEIHLVRYRSVRALVRDGYVRLV